MKREPGYYWARYKSKVEWDIEPWNGAMWYARHPMVDADFAEIDETPITRSINLTNPKTNDDTVPIEKPIGDFIIANATGTMGNDGMYYHYAEVCKLLKLYKK